MITMGSPGEVSDNANPRKVVNNDLATLYFLKDSLAIMAHKDKYDVIKSYQEQYGIEKTIQLILEDELTCECLFKCDEYDVDEEVELALADQSREHWIFNNYEDEDPIDMMFNGWFVLPKNQSPRL